MGCRRCQQQRAKVANAMKARKPATAAKELARGAGMMTGILPKDARPGPLPRTPTNRR